MHLFQMSRRRAWAACALSMAPAHADVVAPPGPHLRRDAVYTVAIVHAVASVASARCPAFRVNTDIDQLGGVLGLTESDTGALNAETASLTKAFRAQVNQAGAKAWCEDVYARFGPSGSMVPGLLHR